MSSLISKTTLYSINNPSLPWTDLEIQYMVAWLGYRDEFGELTNFDLYQTGNKTTAAEKLEVEAKMRALCCEFGQPAKIYVNLFEESQTANRSKA